MKTIMMAKVITVLKVILMIILMMMLKKKPQKPYEVDSFALNYLRFKKKKKKKILHPSLPDITNRSLLSGEFPSEFNAAVVKPLLKTNNNNK